MTNEALLPHNQPADSRSAPAAADPATSDAVKKWAIVAGTILGLAGLTVLHFNGGRAQVTMKRRSLFFEVGRERSSTTEGSTNSSPPQDQSESGA